MIKINLIPTANPTKAGTGQIANVQDVLDKAREFMGGGFKDNPLRKFVLPIVTVYLASGLLEDFQAKETQKADAILSQLHAENAKLKADVAKTKGYESIKKQLESDEQEIRAKLDTVKALIEDRNTPPKLMLSLSQSVPAELWLTEMSIHSKNVVFKGNSVGFNSVSDFMKNLQEGVFFGNVKLQSTQQISEKSGVDIVAFDLVAEKR